MIAYVDASVLLRVALGQPNALPEWPQIEQGVSSALITTDIEVSFEVRRPIARPGQR
jgi:hypothetical protein